MDPSTAEQPQPAPPQRKRRWWQYSISSLLLLITLCAAGLPFIVNPAERQRRAVRFVESLGGEVSYAETERYLAPQWLRRALGDDYFQSVGVIDLGGTQVSDAGLEHLKGLTGLKGLSLYRTQVSDAGMMHLRALTKLESLSLGGTQVSDAGLVHLKALTGLESLFLNDTRVSDAGVTELQRVLPNCQIHRRRYFD